MYRIKRFKTISQTIFPIILCLLLVNFVHAGADETGSGEHESSHHNIEVGKRLFKGLVAPESGKAVSCAACHNTKYIDTLNWNPSAYDIALSASKLDSLTFANRINNPVTKKLSDSHKDISLTSEELENIKGYLGEIKHAGIAPAKPNISKIILFVLMFLVFGWSITDLIIIKKVKKRYIHSLILLVTTVLMSKFMVEESIKMGRSQDYAPAQPIKFSHKVHADQNQIDCQYCHHTAEFSKSAGIPSANLCLNCHTLVREGTNSGRFEINKIHDAVDSLHPIEWVRVHRLPDFVYFNHAQHVGAGKLDCRDCHGPVEEMDVLKQQNDLSMGWCLDCHRTQKVDFFENDYYAETFKELHKTIVENKTDSVTVEKIGGADCMKCHY